MRDRLIGFDEAFQRFGAGRSLRGFREWVAREIRSGSFPPAVKVGHRVAWRESELDGYEARLQRVKYAPRAQAA
jgi:predicted DNA-binding transcriptional regulator AlpA